MADANDVFDLWIWPLGTKFFTWDFTNFITGIGESVDYYFRHESQANLAYTTVRGVAVRYVNIGACELTVTLEGMFKTLSKTLILGLTDPTGTGDVIKNKEYYGAPPPLGTADGKSYTAFYYFGNGLTDEDFQVKLHMDGDSVNQFKIEQVSVIGDGKEIDR